MLYKKIPAHPLRFGATFDFVNKIKLSIKDEGVAMFKGQITKCLLLLEVQHEIQMYFMFVMLMGIYWCLVLSRPKSGPRLAPTLTLLCERTNQSKP